MIRLFVPCRARASSRSAQVVKSSSCSRPETRAETARIRLESDFPGSLECLGKAGRSKMLRVGDNLRHIGNDKGFWMKRCIDFCCYPLLSLCQVRMIPSTSNPARFRIRQFTINTCMHAFSTKTSSTQTRQQILISSPIHCTTYPRTFSKPSIESSRWYTSSF